MPLAPLVSLKRSTSTQRVSFYKRSPLTLAANLHTSGVSQSIALRLLQYWGLKGFREHATRVADFYADRREIFEKLAHKHLDGLATWVSPVSLHYIRG